MGKDLLRIPLFKDTIHRCQAILSDKNIDLMHIITSEDKDIFENVLNSFVGIGAIQIGMINILREIGIEPDFLMGPSFGEVATGYADGCLTEEQTILSAYFRGLVVLEGSNIVGRMAFINLGFEKLSKILPADLDIASHLDANASCVAGPKESIELFVEKMRNENFVTFILSFSNVAFHSRYIAHLAPELLKNLKELIPDPKLRSKKWVSSSVPFDKWNEPETQICSGEYYTNNLLSTVLLKETCDLFPRNSIVLEIAPHFSLKNSIQNSLPEGIYIPLADKERSNGLEVFMEALKDLSGNGINVDWLKVQDVFDNNNL